MHEAVILAAARTPVGRHGGALSSVRPDDLAAAAIREAVARAGVNVAEIEDVYFGCANQAGEDNRNVARMGLLLAGLPIEVPGATINRLCGSGLDAVNTAAKSILAGEGRLYVAGGVESMSRAPYAMPKPEKGYATGNQTVYDTTLGWRFVNPRMRELYGTDAMGETAENLAEEYGIGREEQDRFALHSHQKALRAQEAGHFEREIIPMEIQGRKGSTLVTRDEGPRSDTSLETLSGLRPVFRKGGSVTAGNSSSLNDGASAVVLASREYAQAHGLTPRARVRSFAVAGVPPRIMGIGPVPASRKALSRVGLRVGDLHAIELNEAFAAQSLAVLRDLEIDAQDPRLNPNGGAIALGHALGSSGSRLVTSLLHELERTNGQFGLVTMCIGVGQGIATVIERV
ncbi:acetyl-CoA C-acyltransferase [Deinococcus peraridilitoris]|uniref:Acetyl-CoA acetyltransferase n=1 Tax=Deinococcus peraridilitoris (strain DSM 19664 / LMG 22246 / CIP 109416 / KR-200) TaxID=937777 RepID=K9ZYV6_DEIPD|nr:acetyl-CoA C-acyltransferase [Deinococcus peraridilitoris]AFZ66389.1 acetyl-CoA acetyltransferase [Deinococcus peraridilitoris DSM 19664]